MSPHATYLLGWALLVSMGAVSAWIIAPGLLRAIRIVLSGASVASDPHRPRRPSAPAIKARTALTGEGR